MSNLHHSPRVLAVALIAPLSALLACASGGRGAEAGRSSPGRPAPAHNPLGRDEPVDDTSSVAIGAGKSIDRLLAGRFPGVTVARANGGLQIRIRGGANSFLAGEEPLYVLDGTPLAAGTGGIVHLNPYDIEKIEVLKNPADIGVYGIRGANGVIRITTIRPGR
jgi:TonB-dependent SusC/RagA subfamily outer membrane receptor